MSGHNPFATTEATAAVADLSSSVRSGGGVPKTALYPATITAMFLRPNNFDVAEGKPPRTQAVILAALESGYEWQCTMDILAPDGTPFMADRKTGKPTYMWGAERAQHLIGAATNGKTLGDVWPSIKDAIVKLYDYEKKSDQDTKVSMIGDVVGKKIMLGLQRKIANKRSNSSGTWEVTPDKKTTLEFGVAANMDNKTYVEMRDGVADADVTEVAKWIKMNDGRDWDAYVEVEGAEGVPDSVAVADAPVTSFGS